MTNKEIDIRLRILAKAIPDLAEKRYGNRDPDKVLMDPVRRISIELELLNMHFMAIWAMLGEIAKRLPEEE